MALVGVVASSRGIGAGCIPGAVLGRGVVGVVSSPLRPCGSGEIMVFTERKVFAIVCCVRALELRLGINDEEAGDDRRGERSGMAVFAGGRRVKCEEVGVMKQDAISAHQTCEMRMRRL